MESDNTSVVDTKTIVSEKTRKDLSSICEHLKEHGYEPTKQLVAYLISGDPGYISSYKECRNRLMKYKREEIIETLLVNFID